MDSQRFDTIVRRLGQGATRRSVLKALGAGALGGVLGHGRPMTARAQDELAGGAGGVSVSVGNGGAASSAASGGTAAIGDTGGGDVAVSVSAGDTTGGDASANVSVGDLSSAVEVDAGADASASASANGGDGNVVAVDLNDVEGGAGGAGGDGGGGEGRPPAEEEPGSGTPCTAATCPQGCCGGVCVDLFTDDANCGLCGHACSSDLTCTNGTCCGSDSCQCGQAGSACVVGATCCLDGACYSVAGTTGVCPSA